MADILARLRIDAGQLTLAMLIQERALAAQEIEALRAKLVGPPTQRDWVKRVERPSPSSSDDANANQSFAGGPASQFRKSRSTESRFSHDALLRLKDVSALFGISRSTIYKRVTDRTFPAPLRISQRSVRWRMEDLKKWSDGLGGGA